jgi:alpha-tubulin suppressor-like RCC1 family protein
VTGFARLVFAQPDLAVTAAKAAQSGSIIGWGDQVVGGDMSGRFVAVAAGGYHSLGLKNDGSVVAWGDNSDGQCDVPAPNTGFVAVAASGSVDTGIRGHSLGLNNDGSIMAWGNNRGGQCDVPAPNTGFVAVAAGWYHSLGLKNDGSVVAWGYNWSGECDVPAPNTGFVAVAA